MCLCDGRVCLHIVRDPPTRIMRALKKVFIVTRRHASGHVAVLSQRNPHAYTYTYTYTGMHTSTYTHTCTCT